MANSTRDIITNNNLASFFKQRGLLYLPGLYFANEVLYHKILAKCEKAKAKGDLDTKQIWLGQYYGKEIEANSSPSIVLTWIDDQIGYGVRSTTAIEPYTFIGEYTGIIHRRPFISFKTKNYCFCYEIVAGKGSPYMIDAEKSGNITRYINHSDQPNLESMSVYYKGLIHIILIAIRKIEPGEELTYDYGPEYWKRRVDKKSNSP